jgi:hypothetical protein
LEEEISAIKSRTPPAHHLAPAHYSSLTRGRRSARHRVGISARRRRQATLRPSLCPDASAAAIGSKFHFCIEGSHCGVGLGGGRKGGLAVEAGAEVQIKRITQRHHLYSIRPTMRRGEASGEARQGRIKIKEEEHQLEH